MPRPSSLVVKNGSKMCLRTSASIPTPVSVTEITTRGPAGTSGWSLRNASSVGASATSIVSFPPRGMASRALTARFMSTCSSWPGSARTAAAVDGSRSTSSMSSPMRRRSILESSSMRPPSGTTSGTRTCLRLNARSWRVRAEARSAALRISCILPRRVGSWSLGIMRSPYPRMAVSRLLKSCAMPPASRPTASIFWAWTSCSSRLRRSLTSIIEPSMRTARPSPSRRM